MSSCFRYWEEKAKAVVAVLDAPAEGVPRRATLRGLRATHGWTAVLRAHRELCFELLKGGP